MSLVEENHVRTRGNTLDRQMLYTSLDGRRGQGHGKRAHEAKAETAKGNHMNKTSSAVKMSQTRDEESLTEGGAITPDKADKTTLPSVDNVETSGTTRQSFRRIVRRPSQADNSPTTTQTPTTTIVAECL